MTEADLMRAIHIEASKHGARLFRNNVAQAWVGAARVISTADTVRVYPGDVVIRSARPLHAGLAVGSSDLIGWTPCSVGEQTLARFTAIEVKTKGGRITTEQMNFITAVRAAGGIGSVSRTVEDAVMDLTRVGY